MGNLDVTADVPEADASKVALGQTADITLDALPGTPVTGKVTEISPIATTSSDVVTYPTTIALTAPASTVKVGMSATIDIVTQTLSDVHVGHGWWVGNQGVGDERRFLSHQAKVQLVLLVVGTVCASAPEAVEHLSHLISSSADLAILDRLHVGDETGVLDHESHEFRGIAANAEEL